MEMRQKSSPCARCDEVYEVEWPEALAFYCGAELPPGSRCLIETQRLKHPRGTQNMISEGPLEGCPKRYADERREEVSPEATESAFGGITPSPKGTRCCAPSQSASHQLPQRGSQGAVPHAGYEKARAMLERALREKEAV